MNFFNGKLEKGGIVRFAGAEAAAPFLEGKAAPGSPITIGVRPEHFDRDASADATVDVLVDFVEHLGGTSFVHGHLPDGEKIIIERRDVGDLKSGASIKAGFKTKDMRAFDAEGRQLQ